MWGLCHRVSVVSNAIVLKIQKMTTSDCSSFLPSTHFHHIIKDKQLQKSRVLSPPALLLSVYHCLSSSQPSLSSQNICPLTILSHWFFLSPGHHSFSLYNFLKATRLFVSHPHLSALSVPVFVSLSNQLSLSFSLFLLSLSFITSWWYLFALSLPSLLHSSFSCLPLSLLSYSSLSPSHLFSELW